MRRCLPAYYGLLLSTLVFAMAPVSLAAAQPDDEKELRQLLKQLHHPDSKERWAAAELLADMENLANHADLVIPDLLEALKYKDNFGLGKHKMIGGDSVRDVIAQALKSAGPKGEKALAEKGVAVLIKDLDKEPPDVQYHTLHALRNIGRAAESATPQVMKLTSVKNTIVSRAAIKALAELGPKGLTHLLDMAKQGDTARKLEILGQFFWSVPHPDIMVPALIQFIDDADAGVRAQAAEVLSRIGPAAKDAVPALLKRLDDEQLDLLAKPHLSQFVVAHALAKIGEPAVPGLIKAIDDPKLMVKVKAIHALGEIGPRAKSAIKPIEKALQADKLGMVVYASIALLRLNGDPQEPIKVLSSLLKHPDAGFRAYTLEQLQTLKPPRPELLPAVEALLKDTNATVVMRALQVLNNHGKNARSALPQLIAMLDQPDLRLPVLYLLDEFGPQAKDAVPALIKCLKEKDLNVPRQAADVLGAIGPDAAAAVPALTEAVQGDFLLQGSAVRALAKIGAPAKSAIPAMFKALREDEKKQKPGQEPSKYGLRRYVLEALSDMGPIAADAVPDLVQMLKETANPPADVVHALGSIGPASKEAVPLLQAALKNAKGPLVAAEIHAALAFITGDHAAHLQPMVALFKKMPATKKARLEKMIILELIARLDKSAPHVLPITLDWLKVTQPAGPREVALYILVRLGPAGKDAVPLLVEIARDETAAHRLAALKALAAIGPAAAAAIPALEQLTKEDNPQIHEAAKEALAKIKGK